MTPVLHAEQYKLGIEAATVAVLCYIGFTDFRTFKIRNESVLLLLALYVLYALVARSLYEILFDVLIGAVVFVVLLWFYTKGALGGGDVKLTSVVSLWVGTHCGLLFSVLLLMMIGLHLIAARMNWAPTQRMGGRNAISYAPSIAAALIITILLGCA